MSAKISYSTSVEVVSTKIHHKSADAAMFKAIFSHIRTISHKANLPESLVKLMPNDNPQVSGYLPPAAYSIPPTVYDQLIAFKAERGLESIEMAVTVILSEYFGFTQKSITSGTDTTTSCLETLEAKCSSLTETVAELQTVLAQIQASSSQSLDYQGTPLHQHSPLPLQDKGTATELINRPSVKQGESLEPAAVNHIQMNQSKPEQLPIKEPPSDHQSVNKVPLSGEDSEALALTGVMPSAEREATIASTNGSTDIEPGAASNILKQSNLEQRDGETFSTPMAKADLAKRLGVATSTISRMQSKSNFPEWSNHRDPAGIAWVKSVDGKLFYPQSHKQD